MHSKIYFISSILIFLIFSCANKFNLLAQELSSDQIMSIQNKSLSKFEFTEDYEEKKNEINPFYDETKDYYETITPIEKIYKKRSNKKITLQGYDFFLNRFFPINSYRGGAHDDYIVGPGDSFNIVLQGGTQAIKKSTVSREGVLVFDFFPPIVVSGKTLRETRLDIEKAVESSLIETEVFVSLNKIRSLSINVIGEVVNPGVISVNGLASVTDVLIRAGGIKKTGTLRKIQVFKNNNMEILDLYPIIFSSNQFGIENLYLQDGMVIVVPPIKKTAAIMGQVNREGIFEINEENDTINDLINFASGFSGPIDKTLTLKRIGKKGLDNVTSNFSNNLKLNDYDLLFANNINFKTFGEVKLSGAVISPSIYATDKYPKIQDLIPNVDILKDTAYTFSAIISNKNLETYQDEFKILNLQKILNKTSNFKLQTNDNVIVLNNQDLEFLKSEKVISSLNGNYIKNDSCEAIDILTSQVKAKQIIFSETSILKELMQLGKDSPKEKTITNLNQQVDKVSDKDLNVEKQKEVFLSKTKDAGIEQNTSCPQIFIDNPSLLSFLIENIIILKGNFQYPGVHLVDKDTNLKEILNFAKANSGKVLVSPNSKTIQLIENKIVLRGAFRFPGEMRYNKGISLSKIFKNNNLLRDDTYPFYGLIERNENYDGVKSFITFSPRSILSKIQDVKLFTGDKITLFTENEINLITNTFFSEKKSQYENINENLYENQDSKTEEKNQIDFDNSTQELKVSSLFRDDNIKDLEVFEINSNNLNDQELSKTKNENEINTLNNKSFVSDSQILQDLSLKTNFSVKTINLIKLNFVEISGVDVFSGFYPLGGPTILNELISYAGLTSINGIDKRIEIISNDGDISVSDIVNPGDKIYIPSVNTEKLNITLSGEFENPRKIGFRPGLKLSEILNSIYELTDNAYIYFASIERRNRNNLKSFIAFSPNEIISNSKDIPLEKGDRILIFSNNEINKLINKYASDDTDLTPEKVNLIETTDNSVGSIEELVKRYTFRIEGAVVNPGQYLLAGHTFLKNIIDVAGGLSKSADLNKVQVSSPITIENGNIKLDHKELLLSKIGVHTYLIAPGSLIRFPKVESDLMLGNISIKGEVNQPGIYRIGKNNSLFDLLVKTGGLTEDAFLDGLVFSREEERKREEASVKRLVRELDKSIAAALENQPEVTSFDAESIFALRELALAASDFKPIGRVVGNFKNIDVLKNIKLTSGDKIFIPKKPSSVTVVGEVMTPGSLLWVQNQTARSYINSAAGFTELADKDKVFIISPNGKATRKSQLWGANSVKSGSTIVVPRKIVLTSTLGKVSAVTSVIYQLTLTLAGIDSLLGK